MGTARTIARTRRPTLRTLEATTLSTTAGPTLWTALEDRLATHRHSRPRACTGRRLRRLDGTRWGRRRRGVHRTWSGLRHDHATAGRLLAKRNTGNGPLRGSGWSHCFWQFNLWRVLYRRRSHWRRRNGRLHFGSFWCGRGRRVRARFDNLGWWRRDFNGRRRTRGGMGNRCSRRTWRRDGRTLRGYRLRRDEPRTGRLCDRRFGRGTRRLREDGRLLRRRLCRLRFLRNRARRLHRRSRRRSGRRRRSSLLRQRLEHIARLRDLREIDLRLELIGRRTMPSR